MRRLPTRRRFLATAAGAAAWSGLLRFFALPAAAMTKGGPVIGRADAATVQTDTPGLRFFRIGTGTTAGTYFPIGGLIANAISSPPGARPCDKGGSCGVPGLVAVAQATAGSVENLNLLMSGGVEAAMAQADVAFAAYTGSGVFQGRAPFDRLRSIGTLYVEALHAVVRAESDIFEPGDFRNHTVALGDEGSGTLVEARLALAAYGVREADLTPLYLQPGSGAERVASGEIDGFFIVGGAPVGAVSDLAERRLIRLVPFSGPEADRLRTQHRFLTATVIPEGVYPGVLATPTLGVGAELLVRADLPTDLIYGISRALWHENTRRLLAEGHPKGKLIDPAHAAANVSVPLHPGAERYYREVGLVGNAANEAAPALR